MLFRSLMRILTQPSTTDNAQPASNPMDVDDAMSGAPQDEGGGAMEVDAGHVVGGTPSQGRTAEEERGAGHLAQHDELLRDGGVGGCESRPTTMGPPRILGPSPPTVPEAERRVPPEERDGQEVHGATESNEVTRASPVLPTTQHDRGQNAAELEQPGNEGEPHLPGGHWEQEVGAQGEIGRAHV